MFHHTFCIIFWIIMVQEWLKKRNCFQRHLVYTFQSYSDLKNNFDNAIHTRKARKTRFLLQFCLHFFVCSCRLNSKTLKCRQILHFQKHSSLQNRFWKRTMFFVFSFFHFLCNLRISTSSLSVTKNEILSYLH